MLAVVPASGQLIWRDVPDPEHEELTVDSDTDARGAAEVAERVMEWDR